MDSSSNINNNTNTPACMTPLSTGTEPYGKIVVIKRSGQDSASFELIESGYTFGRAVDCDIRIQLLSISENHCKITRNDHGQAIVTNFSENGTLINGQKMHEETVVLRHNDLITLVERSFRYEYTPEMMAREQLAKNESMNSNNAHASGTITLVGETPRKPSSLSASVFSVSEIPSSPITPRTPNAAALLNNSSNNKSQSLNASYGQSPKIPPSPIGSAIVDSEITASPKLSPKVSKIEENGLISALNGNPFAVIISSTLAGDVTSASDNLLTIDNNNDVEMCEIVVGEQDKNPFDTDSTEMISEVKCTVNEGTTLNSEPVNSDFKNEATILFNDEHCEEVVEKPIVVELEGRSLEAPAINIEHSDVCLSADVQMMDVVIEPAGVTTDIACDSTTEVIESNEIRTVEVVNNATEVIEATELNEALAVPGTHLCDLEINEKNQSCNSSEIADCNVEVSVCETESKVSAIEIVPESVITEIIQPAEIKIETCETVVTIDSSVEQQLCPEIIAEVFTDKASETVEVTDVQVRQCDNIEIAVNGPLIIDSVNPVEAKNSVDEMEVDSIEEQEQDNVMELNAQVIETVCHEPVAALDNENLCAESESVVVPDMMQESISEIASECVVSETVVEEVKVEQTSEGVVEERTFESVEPEPTTELIKSDVTENVMSESGTCDQNLELSDIQLAEQQEMEQVETETVEAVTEFSTNENVEEVALLPVTETEIVQESVDESKPIEIETIDTVVSLAGEIAPIDNPSSTFVEQVSTEQAIDNHPTPITETIESVVEAAEVDESITVDDSNNVLEPCERDSKVSEEIVSVEVSFMENSNSSTLELSPVDAVSIEVVVLESDESQRDEGLKTEESTSAAVDADVSTTVLESVESIVVEVSSNIEAANEIPATPKRSRTEDENETVEDEPTPGPQRKSTRIHHLTPQPEKRATRSSSVKSKSATKEESVISSNVRVTRSRAQSTESPASPCGKSRSCLNRKSEDCDRLVYENENEKSQTNSTNALGKNSTDNTKSSSTSGSGSKRSLRSRVIE